MPIILGKTIRLGHLLNAEDDRAIIFEADEGLMLGPTPGLLDLPETVSMVKNKVDGIVLSSGQVERSFEHFKGKGAPALLVRADWTNAFRDETYFLPTRNVRHVLNLGPKDAVALGASALAAFLFVGYDDDEDEARNLETVAMLARESEKFGLPLLVECIPIGGRMTEINYLDCAKLATRMAVEAGADIVATPYTGNANSFKEIVDASKTPVLMLDRRIDASRLLEAAEESLKAGATGVVVGRSVHRAVNPLAQLTAIHELIHRSR
jgi:DhnA family fructose-bisphosphate aldolase class Ia